MTFKDSFCIESCVSMGMNRKLCHEDCVEDEAHFLFNCKFYNHERNSFINEHIRSLHFYTLDNPSKFKLLMQNWNILATAKYFCQIYVKRKNILFGS